ncbi:hypothetical protein [Paractinoplanes atraurantiacus]|uniref:hypothetical protein n=1 Tax=Paractinoplanes atraurantiacus TaxID=1036182 RepID=UPI001FE279E0|nr:hypothetical protein [Actinoplanes atraurantiacus]
MSTIIKVLRNALVSGRFWAYMGSTLGAAVSIAANVAHSYIPPTGSPDTWTPKPGAVIGAIVWPVFLFIAVEILARVAWPHRWWWQLLRFISVTPVAAVAALVSYRHLSGLLAYYGEEDIVRVLGPLAVDGLMVMATGALLATGHRDTTPAASTTTQTTQSTTSHDLPVPAPANPVDTAPSAPAVPPRTTAATPTGDTTPQPRTTPAPTPEPAADTRTDVPTPAQVATRVTPDPAKLPLRSPAERPATPGVSKPRPRKTAPTRAAEHLAAPADDFSVSEPEPAQLPLPYTVDPALLVKARETAEQYRTEHGVPIKAGQLAARLKVNSDVAAQALAVLDLGPNSPTTPVPTVNGNPVKASR